MTGLLTFCPQQPSMPHGGPISEEMGWGGSGTRCSMVALFVICRVVASQSHTKGRPGHWWGCHGPAPMCLLYSEGH